MNDCATCKYVTQSEDDFPCSECTNNYTLKYEPMTLFSKIHNMTSYEMAAYFKTVLRSDMDVYEIEKVLLEPIMEDD